MNGLKEKVSKTLSSKNFMVVVSLLGLYLLSTGTSWAVFSYLKSGSSTFSSEGLEADRLKISDLPKTEECPINGMMFSEPERNIWEARRPIAAMIENHKDARPIEGIYKADVVYETVAEGGITRFLGIFYCGVAAENVRIAPVRSARVYFIDWAAEYGEYPIFVHVGGANNQCSTCPGGVKYYGQVAKEADAVSKLFDLEWRVRKGNDFDTHWDVAYPVLMRDPERLGHPIATEHTMFSNTDAIYEEAEERGFAYEDSDGSPWDETYVPWKFAEGSPSDSPDAKEISFEFWEDSMLSGDYAVVWKYDGASNSYLRNNDGEKFVDLATGTQVSAKNVVILYTKERTSVDKEGHVLYTTIGEGDILVFQNGNVIEGTWEKESTLSRTMFYDADGEEIEFVKGQIWIEILPIGNNVNY